MFPFFYFVEKYVVSCILENIWKRGRMGEGGKRDTSCRKGIE